MTKGSIDYHTARDLMHFLLTITLYTRFAIGALHSKFEKKTRRLRQLRDFIGVLLESNFYQKNYLHRWEKLLRRIWNLTLKGKAFSFFQNIFIRKRSEEQKKKKILLLYFCTHLFVSSNELSRLAS